MEISPASFLQLVHDISKAVSQKDSATHYDDFLLKIFEDKFPPYDAVPFIFNFPSEIVFGRDHEKDSLLSKLIVFDDETETQLSVIPIVGRSGIGKTTLARLVYEDARVEEQFEVRVWVKVDDLPEFNVKHAARGILKSAMGMACSLDDLDELDEMVRDIIRGQRCLIVFDGIESMSKDSWLHMNQCWFDLLGFGSKVVITTPCKDIADLVAEQSFELKQLSSDNGWSLFKCIAFDLDEVILHKSENLALACGGIPLLLKLFGSLIRYDHKIRDLFLDSTLLPFSRDASATILLCLWALPPHLRRCLAYCALFPKGYALSKEKIVDMWNAAGLFKPYLVDIGDTYFRQLLSRSFFTDITRDHCNEIIEFRVPSLIHEVVEDVARIVYREALGLIGSVGEDASQLSLVFPFAAKHMRTLILSPTLYFGGSLDHSLSDFQELHSLDLSCSGINNLSDDISLLTELRYLNLSHTLIERLPHSITDLSSLQTLDLSWCYHLKVLPEGLGDLMLMSHLDLSRCESLTYIPSGIGSLVYLSSMPLFVLGNDRYCAGLGELGRLRQLRGKLEIRNLENVMEIIEAYGAVLDQKRLRHLDLSWSQNADNCFEVLELLQPNEQLKVLNLTGYNSFEFPEWISSINSLMKISITDCGCTKLPSLGQLPFLKELQLKGMRKLKFIGPEFYGYGNVDVVFQSLEQLELYDLPRLLKWSSASVNNAFLNLKSLTIEGCSQLRLLPFFPTLPDLILSNSSTKIFFPWMTRLQSLRSLLMKDMEFRWHYHHGAFDALKKLILHNVQDVLFEFGLVTRTALEHLVILQCNELEHMNFRNYSLLKKLHIVNCQNLWDINMPKVEDFPLMELVLEDCPRLVYAHISYRGLPCLRKMMVRNCRRFFLHQFGKLEKLQYLSISGCPRMESELQTHSDLISHVPCIIVEDHKVDYKDAYSPSVPLHLTHNSTQSQTMSKLMVKAPPNQDTSPPLRAWKRLT